MEPASDIATAAVAHPAGALGYPWFEVGLNNQKMALCGLFLTAREARKPLVLPNFCIFNPSSGLHAKIPLDRVYPLEGLYRFARAFGFDILDHPPVETVSAWDCFVKGSERIATEAVRGLAAVDDMVSQFVRTLRPHLATSAAFRKLQSAVFRERNIRVAVQLRVEKDWNKYSADTLTGILRDTEDYNPSFLQIMGKIRHEFGAACDAAFIVCDESDLPFGKDDIRDAVMAHHGIRLIWKSDILDAEELVALSTLEQSILDFEVAAEAPVFVGLSRSTFSNMIGFEALCRRRVQPRDQYIYNLPGPQLARRRDNGGRLAPHDVMNTLYERRPLLPPSGDDIHWRASLVAHVSAFGDLWSEGGAVAGVYCGAMVGGERRDAAGRFIEGFGVVSGMSTLTLDYRARLDDGCWTAWAAAGSFVGTKGRGRALSGFSLRLTGPLSLGFHCLCIGSFSGRPDLVVAGPGQDCTTDEPLRLEAMQLLFRRS